MHNIMVKKEALPRSHDDTLLWHSPDGFLCMYGCTLDYVCMCANKKKGHASDTVMLLLLS